MPYEIHLKDEVGNKLGIGKTHTVETINTTQAGFIGVDGYFLPISNILYIKVV